MYVKFKIICATVIASLLLSSCHGGSLSNHGVMKTMQSVAQGTKNQQVATVGGAVIGGVVGASIGSGSGRLVAGAVGAGAGALLGRAVGKLLKK